MKKLQDYVIREYDGVFKILVKTPYEIRPFIPIFQKAKKVYRLAPVDIYGNPISDYKPFIEYEKTFKSLEECENRIKIYVKGRRHYEYNEDGVLVENTTRQSS